MVRIARKKKRKIKNVRAEQFILEKKINNDRSTSNENCIIVMRYRGFCRVDMYLEKSFTSGLSTGIVNVSRGKV